MWLCLPMGCYTGLTDCNLLMESLHLICSTDYIDRPPELPSYHFMQNETCYGSCKGRLRSSYSVILPFRGLFTVKVRELMNYDNDVDTWCLKHDILRNYDLRDIHIHESEENIHVVGFHPNDGGVVFYFYF